MTWWKVFYNFQRQTWDAYGHIGFVQAETHGDAVALAEEMIALAEPGATITLLEVTPSTDAARQRFLEKLEAARVWQANVVRGIPNRRGAL